MEDTKSIKQVRGEEEFHDSLDGLPFDDCLDTFSESIESNSEASITDGNTNPSPEDNALPSEGIRRRSHSQCRSSTSDSSELSNISSSESVDNCSGERKAKHPRKIRDCEKKFGKEDSLETKSSSESKSEHGVEKNETNEEHSTISDANADARGDLGEVESNLRGSDDANSSLLFTLAGIVIRSISFQFSLLVKSFMFPVYFVYYLYMLVFNPFGLVKNLCCGYLFQNMKRIWNFLFGIVSEFMFEWLKEHRAIWKMGLKCGWGLLWSAYVCAVLVGLLVSAFVMGGILIRVVVEDPIRIKNGLNFNYLQKSPVAIVPILPQAKLNHDMYLVEKTEILKASQTRVLPYNHRLKVTVSLTLPESEYNQRLGIFQVRVDFLAADGKILTTSRRPCMLQYKSHSIRLLLTLLKVAPILTGYTSETQTLKISFKDLTEGETPTAALRVVIEQRAEYSPGAGIPEIYGASLSLDSELPILKRILWFWKKTVYIWVSMSIFLMEIVFALLCCRPMIIPKIRLREAANRDARQSNPPRET
ncbi:hypothetical protein ACS0TY_017930 [Phlomoides rotata]